MYITVSRNGLSLCLRDRVLRVQFLEKEKKEEKDNSSQSSLVIYSSPAVLWPGPPFI
jgi:hypothetical protein